MFSTTRKKGFTLVELIVVIAIIAILTTVSIVGYNAFVKNANQSKAEQELTQIVNVLRAQAGKNIAVDFTDNNGTEEDSEDDVTYTLTLGLRANKILFTVNPATVTVNSDQWNQLFNLLFEELELDDSGITVKIVQRTDKYYLVREVDQNSKAEVEVLFETND